MDKYYIYRPLFALIGKGEGTDRKRGYNETLGYGAFTGGNVDLVSMNLGQIDALQTKMLPNKLNSSALGRYQIVRTTLRRVKKLLKLSDKELFNPDMQDKIASFLLNERGVEKWLNGRLKTDTLINNLAREWASFPQTDGTSAYAVVRKGDNHVAQSALIKVSEVREALAEVKRRHKDGLPEVVPQEIDKEVKEKFNLIQWLTGVFGSSGLGFAALSGWDWKALLAVGAMAGGAFVLVLVFRHQILQAIKELREGVTE